MAGSAILAAPKPVRDAAVAIDDLAARYGVLRDAQSKLAAVAPPSTDEGLYFELRNPEAFRENRRLNAPLADRRPRRDAPLDGFPRR